MHHLKVLFLEDMDGQLKYMFFYCPCAAHHVPDFFGGDFAFDFFCLLHIFIHIFWIKWNKNCPPP